MTKITKAELEKKNRSLVESSSGKDEHIRQLCKKNDAMKDERDRARGDLQKIKDVLKQLRGVVLGAMALKNIPQDQSHYDGFDRNVDPAVEHEDAALYRFILEHTQDNPF